MRLQDALDGNRKHCSLGEDGGSSLTDKVHKDTFGANLSEMVDVEKVESITVVCR